LNIQISQGSVVTDMRWGGSVCSCLFCSLSLSAKLKELFKLDHICQSYHKNWSGFVLSGTWRSYNVCCYRGLRMKITWVYIKPSMRCLYH